MDEVQSVENWPEQMIALQSSIPTIKDEGLIAALKAFSNIADLPGIKVDQQLFSSPQWKSIQKSIQEISKIQIDIPPALVELKKITASMQQTVPPELLKLEEAFQTFKPNPEILEMIEDWKKSQDETSIMKEEKDTP